MPPRPQHPIEPDEPPPLFRTWGRMYAAVGAYLAIIILLFDVFTRVLNR